MNNTLFNKKVIVLTGASGGIGSAIAKALSNKGALLILVGRNSDKLTHLNNTMGGQHHCLSADLTSEAGRNDLLHFCRQFQQGIDMLINNAGISDFALLDTMKPDRISDMITTNLTSPILICQLLLPLLRAQPQARIINIGSAFGSIGFPGFSVYCGSKFGLRGFTEALRRELMDSHVLVQYFAPRATKTAINNDTVMAMNSVLGTQMDPPDLVADALITSIEKGCKNSYLGWPEKLFVRINGLLPNLVDKSILKQLPIIKRYL